MKRAVHLQSRRYHALILVLDAEVARHRQPDRQLQSHFLNRPIAKYRSPTQIHMPTHRFLPRQLLTKSRLTIHIRPSQHPSPHRHPPAPMRPRFPIHLHLLTLCNRRPLSPFQALYHPHPAYLRVQVAPSHLHPCRLISRWLPIQVLTDHALRHEPRVMGLPQLRRRLPCRAISAHTRQ